MRDPDNSANQSSLGQAASVDTLVVGTAPSQSHAMLDAVLTQALGLAMYNAVTAQQNASAARNAAVLTTCMAMLSVPIANAAESAAQPSARAATALQAASSEKTPAPDAAKPDQPVAGQSTGAASAGDSSAAQDGDGKATIDPQVLDAVNQIQQAVLSPQVVLTSGAGKAYQLVAQSAAIAVQDATDALRAVSIVAATAAGVAMTKFLIESDPKYLLGLTAARDMMATATDDFAKVGVAAAGVVKEFPAG